jgi:hypothetical protein
LVSLRKGYVRKEEEKEEERWKKEVICSLESFLS